MSPTTKTLLLLGGAAAVVGALVLRGRGGIAAITGARRVLTMADMVDGKPIQQVTGSAANPVISARRANATRPSDPKPGGLREISSIANALARSFNQ